jgi:hypothetical protein
MPTSRAANSHVAFAALLVALVCVACAPRETPGVDALRLRLSEYEQSWVKRDLRAVWALMSPRVRQGNDNDPAVFEKQVRDAGLWVSRLEVQAIELKGARAVVREKVTYTSSAGDRVGDEEEDSEWVLLDGQWFLDAYMSVATK